MGERFDNLRNRVSELIDPSADEEPEPQGFQGEERSSDLVKGGVLENDPQRDNLNYYRELYENLGPIKSAIDNLSSEVIEPGWYITADSDETVDELTEFFNNVAVLNTETDQPASLLIEEMVREREIKGTIFLEKMTDSQGRNQGLYPLQNDTITIYTKPGKAMLPAPDDGEAEPFDVDVPQSRDQPPLNADGEMGAYVQFDNIQPRWSGNNEIVFTRDQVIKWTRDAPMGEPRGQSRIASSAQRAEGLLEKLNDNDDAVKFKAWPQIIFELGSEDNPWNEEEVNNFISQYEEGTISPGMLQAVAGDVEIEEFAGETADIQETLDFDISMIMSGLPGPVHATGGFAQNVEPAVAQSQQRQFIKEVKKTRREIERLLTPYLQEVAKDYNLDAADSVELHLGRPHGNVAPEDIEGSIIRYTSDANPVDNEVSTAISSDDVVTDPDDTKNKQKSSTGGSKEENADRATDSLSVDSSFPVESNSEFEGLDELSDPRLVSTREIESELEDLLYEELHNTRESLAEAFEDTYDRPLRQAGEMESVAYRTAQESIESAYIDARSRPYFEDTIKATLSTLGQENHDPQMNIEVSARHRQRARFLSGNMQDAFENAVEDMTEFMQVNARQAVQHNESPHVIAERLRESHDDDELRSRAQTMARVEVMSAVNSLKMAEYDRHRDIVGVELINPCNKNTTPLCQELACESDTTAMFDADETLGEQFSAEVNDSLLFDGFDPLPNLPPYHFGCRTEIVPVTQNE